MWSAERNEDKPEPTPPAARNPHRDPLQPLQRRCYPALSHLRVGQTAHCFSIAERQGADSRLRLTRASDLLRSSWAQTPQSLCDRTGGRSDRQDDAVTLCAVIQTY